MNNNPFKLIHKYNKEKGLLDSGYNSMRECAFPIEEALESLDIQRLKKYLNVKEFGDAKDVSRRIMSFTDGDEPKEVDILDKHIDIIIYSVGSIYKLGLSPQELLKAIEVVMIQNMKKTDSVDSHGKNIKGKDWEDPASELQTILDRR